VQGVLGGKVFLLAPPL